MPTENENRKDLVFQFIQENLNQLEQWKKDPGKPATMEDVAELLGNSIPKGPADTLAIYDFYTLNIAFENIWQEVFGDELSKRAQTLYQQFVENKDTTPEVENIETIEDIKTLISESDFLLQQNVAMAGVPDYITEKAPWITSMMWANLSPDQQSRVISIIVKDEIDDVEVELPIRDISLIIQASQAIILELIIQLDNAGLPPGFPALIRTNLNNVLKEAQREETSIEQKYKAIKSILDMAKTNADGLRKTAEGDAKQTNLAKEVKAELITLETQIDRFFTTEPPSSEATPPKSLRQQLMEIFDSNVTEGEGQFHTRISNSIPSSIEEINNILNSAYSFAIYAEETVNFAILLNYRQEWNPQSYQVGELVNTIPLAPKEVRKYTKKKTVKESRKRKEVNNALSIRRSDTTHTGRAERQVVDRANENTSFNASASVNGTVGVVGFNGSTGIGANASKDSSRTKKNFREAVSKSAQELKSEQQLEVELTSSMEMEDTYTGEISNPNEEIPVTFLFYELQRRFKVHEYLHDAMPVILVANPVPNPDEISEAWLMQHEWMLRRAILDDSFLPSLDLLKHSKSGLNVEIDTLRAHVQVQMKTFEETKTELTTFVNARSLAERSLREAVDKSVDALNAAEDDGGMGMIGDVVEVFMPQGILGDLAKTLHGQVMGQGPQAESAEAAEARQNAAEEALARIDRSLGESRTRLAGVATALDQAIQKYTQAMKARMDRQLAITKLILHVKDNIIYYMQAIWDHEPPDQRYLRLMDIEVPTFGTFEVAVKRNEEQGVSITFDGNFNSDGAPFVSLKEIADLDNLLGYKGNFMLFPLREEHPITAYMMQDYLNEHGEIKDPDESLESVLRGKRGERIWDSLEEKLREEVIQPIIEKLEKKAKEDIADLRGKKYRPEVLREEIQQVNKKLSSAITYFRNKELNKISELKKEIFGAGKENVVVVPSDLLFIAALPGTNPILEDFKLKHRGLDVLKVAAELEEHQIELIRRKARLLDSDYDDPDVDKHVTIDGHNSSVIVDSE